MKIWKVYVMSTHKVAYVIGYYADQRMAQKKRDEWISGASGPFPVMEEIDVIESPDREGLGVDRTTQENL